MSSRLARAAVLCGVLSVAVYAKDCVFLHGSGVNTPGPVTETYTDYWGDIHEVRARALRLVPLGGRGAGCAVAALRDSAALRQR